LMKLNLIIFFFLGVFSSSSFFWLTTAGHHFLRHPGLMLRDEMAGLQLQLLISNNTLLVA
jgi:hypothetical protein